jgi:hypothetical protein
MLLRIWTFGLPPSSTDSVTLLPPPSKLPSSSTPCSRKGIRGSPPAIHSGPGKGHRRRTARQRRAACRRGAIRRRQHRRCLAQISSKMTPSAAPPLLALARCRLGSATGRSRSAGADAPHSHRHSGRRRVRGTGMNL